VSVATAFVSAGARGSQAVVELLLVRHALPVRRELEVGAADPELSEDGLAQARHLAEYLAAEAPLDALYASPLNRARQTAAPIAARFGLEVVVDDAVAEWDRHSNEYVPIEELKAADDPRWQALLRGEWTSHDETPEQFAARVVGAIEAMVGRHRGERVAVVCHGGVINTYLAHVLGLERQHSFFYPNYTSIHRVAAATTGERSVVTINETAHLRGTGLPIGLFQR
jgi:2,3-bisphosphoglycerate-dependent phosphoglycerate mutase